MKTITLPWPPSKLNPNARVHWAAKAKLAKQYRQACQFLTLESGVKFSSPGRIKIDVTFFPPDKRHRDSDNMIASIKSGLDGLADGLGVNDRQFLPTFRFEDQIGGMVKITFPGLESEAE